MGRDSSRWITKGIKVSYQRMRFLNNFKRNLTLTSEVFNYINRCHSTYKRVIYEAKGDRESDREKENDRLVESSKYSIRVMWQLTNTWENCIFQIRILS